MEDQNFARLKELYHPGFLADAKYGPLSKESQIEEAMSSAKRLHLKAPVRNRVIELLSEYGRFHFTKTERISGDEIRFEFFPLLLPVHPDSNEKTAFIGAYKNRSCSLYLHENTHYIERFYVDAAGLIRNQDHRLIAENITDFWEYIMEKEYDYHPEITDDVMNLLRGAGWYEGRRINIDALLEECMEDDVFPSDIQIAFIQEFGGLGGKDLLDDDQSEFWFPSNRSHEWRQYGCFLNLTKKAEQQIQERGYARTEDLWVLRHFDADTLHVGYCGWLGEHPVYLTPDGQLITRQRKVGRNIWEGIQCIVGY